MKTAPVLFLIFNRPEHTYKVFEEIRIAKPHKLYVAADGSRVGHATDKENCALAREVVSTIDWDCEIKTLFREENLSCGPAVSQAIDWFFENEEAGIILEDDCLPSPSFFRFCTSMLDKYENDPKIYHISGFSWVTGLECEENYFFSKYPNIWGWATWRDRWNKYDFKLSKSEDKKTLQGIKKYINHKIEFAFHKMTFNSILKKKTPETWDYQWKFCVFNNQGLCITPLQLLINNIGMDQYATRTKRTEFPQDLLLELGEKIIHPSKIVLTSELDEIHRTNYLIPKAEYFHEINSLLYPLKSIIKSIILYFKKTNKLHI